MGSMEMDPPINMNTHNEKSRPLKPHYPATKTQNKLIYNYYAIIL
jgi:hypothetical protein